MVELLLLLLFVLHFATLLPLVCSKRIGLVLTVKWEDTETAGREPGTLQR